MIAYQKTRDHKAGQYELLHQRRRAAELAVDEGEGASGHRMVGTTPCTQRAEMMDDTSDHQRRHQNCDRLSAAQAPAPTACTTRGIPAATKGEVVKGQHRVARARAVV